MQPRLSDLLVVRDSRFESPVVITLAPHFQLSSPSSLSRSAECGGACRLRHAHSDFRLPGSECSVGVLSYLQMQRAVLTHLGCGSRLVPEDNAGSDKSTGVDDQCRQRHTPPCSLPPSLPGDCLPSRLPNLAEFTKSPCVRRAEAPHSLQPRCNYNT